MTSLDSRKIRPGWKLSKADQFGLWDTICDGIPSREEADIQWSHLVKSFPQAKLRMSFVEIQEMDVNHHG